MSDKSLLQDFITETGEHLETTEHNLMRLEQQPDDVALLNDIFRSIHTIKGSSEYLGMERIAELSHKLENLLDLLRRGEQQADADVIELLIETNDRLGTLLDEIAQHEAEKSSIDDLLARIAARVDGPSTAQGAAEAAVADDQYDDEYDEELFDIFAGQLKEGLLGLADDATQLKSGEAAETVLENCVERLSTLQSSANYMGYDELKGMYDQWLSAVDDVKGQLKNGEQVDLDALSEQVQANVDQVKALFPRVFPPVQETATPEAPEKAAAPSLKVDAGLLSDFISETGEQLEEAQNNLTRLQQQPDDVALLNDIFRSIHTIKGSSQYLGIKHIAELSHKLENMLDLLRNGEMHTDADMIKLLIETNDRLGTLVDEIAQHEIEKSSIDDLLARIASTVDGTSTAQGTAEAAVIDDQEEDDEYDEELFDIFAGQLKEGLQGLVDDATQLKSGEAVETVFENCVERLSTLQSSANYMGYDELKGMYDQWLSAVDDVKGQLKTGEQVDLEALSGQIQANVDQVKALFPRVFPPAQETATPEVQETATPEVQETATPEAQETATPEVQETATPEVQETATPEVQETTTPEAQETAIPEAPEKAPSVPLKDAAVDEAATAPIPDEPVVDTKVYTNAEGVVYEEAFDKELFGIFIEQLNAGLQNISHETDQLRSSDTPESVLARCADQLAALRSSANYMDYDDLKTVYDKWLKDVEAVQGRLAENKEVDLGQLVDNVMQTNLQAVKTFFSGHPVHDEPAIPKTIEKQEEKLDETLASIDTISLDNQQEFKVVSLADLEDDPVIEVEGSISESRKGDDDSLLNQLKSAFESNVGELYKEENGSLPKEMEESLLSGGHSASQQTVNVEISHDIMDEYAQEEDQSEEVKTMLFSGSDKDQPPQPETDREDIQVALSDTLDTSERRRGYGVGRRKSDRFRDRMAKQSIRVDAAKIDVLMNQVGELVVSRSGFMQLINDLREMQFFLKQSQKLDQKEMQWVKEITNRITDATASFGRVTAELQENVMKVRMLPIAQLFSRYPRLVHDLVKGTQKKVSLEIRGEDTELDKMVIEQIADPLVHIIRNAVDHGIEDVAERQKYGKPEEGSLRLGAYHESNYVVIEISDDGRGMDVGQIKSSAIERGFATEQEVEGMGEKELLTLIMRPGFSTAAEVTHTSGRGVGMDVVKDNIEKLNGTVDIESSHGAGVTIRIKIPLTLAIIPALMVRVVDELFTIPLPAVDETMRIKSSDISTVEGLEVYYLREKPVPLIRLSQVFNMQTTEPEQEELFVVIVNAGAKQIGLVVDELKARQEVVIKPLEDYLQEKSGFSGATILGDGSISLIISVPELVQLALGRHEEKIKLATA